ncbi:MAG: carboxyl-terminal processing protease [Chloroflexota bacterium]|jgi:carboxyl-terminal processing protease|nr:carboxyl-terminal processing protease [Chloroflexota bacterium]
MLLVIPLSFYGGVMAQFHFGPELDAQIRPILFARHSNGLDFGTLQQVYDFMNTQYARPDLSENDAFNGAAKGMVQLYLNDKFGDRFSAYLTPDEFHKNQQFLSGRFAGIGVTVRAKDGKVAIIDVLPDSPAQRAGVKAGDVITAIDGKSVDGVAITDVSDRIRGNADTTLKLTVSRAGQSMDFDITRKEINAPSVRSKDVAPGVLYIRIYEFGERTGDDFETQLQQGLNRGDSRVILDLRGNGGGFVSASDRVTSEFVQSGINVVTVGRDGKRDEHKVSGHGVAFSQKLVVLIDEGTASASEIVAGALEDNHRATLVGKKSFGKGSVQDDFVLRNGGDLHLTIAYWYRPNGETIERNGITPDKDVALDKPENAWDVVDASSDPKADAQLQAALTALK